MAQGFSQLRPLEPFVEFDVNQDGYIDADEFRAVKATNFSFTELDANVSRSSLDDTTATWLKKNEDKLTGDWAKVPGADIANMEKKVAGHGTPVKWVSNKQIQEYREGGNGKISKKEWERKYSNSGGGTKGALEKIYRKRLYRKASRNHLKKGRQEHFLTSGGSMDECDKFSCAEIEDRIEGHDNSHGKDKPWESISKNVPSSKHDAVSIHFVKTIIPRDCTEGEKKKILNLCNNNKSRRERRRKAEQDDCNAQARACEQYDTKKHCHVDRQEDPLACDFSQEKACTDCPDCMGCCNPPAKWVERKADLTKGGFQEECEVF